MSLYTDFDLSFELLGNGDIAALSDEGCIRQMIKNSVQMNSFDIPFNTWYAANINNYLFEQPNKIMESEIITTIRDVLLLDPRVRDPIIEIEYSPDLQFCYIDIKVFIVILNKTILEKITIERVR